MKIAHIIGKMKTAGVESVVFTYLRAMPLDKIDVDVLYDADSTAAPPSDLVSAGVRFIEIPPYQKLFSYLKELKKIFKEERYDIVHSHMNALSVFPLWAAKRAGIEHRICHNHTMTSGAERKRNMMKLILKPFSVFAATDFAACSELSGRWMFGDKRYDEGRVKLFYNAINFERFRFSESARNEVRSRYGVGNSILLGHAGRFFGTKNHEFLIDILAECKRKKIDAKLMLIGDGETKDSIVRKARDSGVEADVIFTGVVGDIEKYYSAMDIFLLPSLYEGLPVVSVEAQASGLECLLSDTVTVECKMTEHCSFLPITQGTEPWTDRIEKFVPIDRNANSGSFKNSKFNIDNSAFDMIQYYNEIICTSQTEESL